MSYAQQLRILAAVIAEQDARRWQGGNHPQPKERTDGHHPGSN